MEIEKNQKFNLVLDYDGVIAYKDPIITKRNNDFLFDYIVNNSDLKLLHINSLRGISFFRSEFFQGLIKLQSQKELYFSGCFGAFTVNLNTNTLLYQQLSLPKETLGQIVNNNAIKRILQQTQQNDESSWSKFTHQIAPEVLNLISIQPNLYWDIGTPDSNQISKCAIDLPNNFDPDIIDELRNELINCTLCVTNNILEIVPIGQTKRTTMKLLAEKQIYFPGRIIAIGDNPEGSDKEMLNAFGDTQLKSYTFTGLTNNNGGDNEETLQQKFSQILQSL